MASEDLSGKPSIFSSLLGRISSILRSSPKIRASEQDSQAASKQTRTLERPRLTDDPVKSAVLMFLVLILTLAAVLAVTVGIVLALKGDKASAILFAVFGGIVKGMLSIIKMLVT